MKLYKDRQEAGELLAKKLKNSATLVLGIPRGGIVVAAKVAEVLKLPLDIIVTRKIGAPGQKELALGAVDADGEAVWDYELITKLGLTINGLKELVADEVKEIKRRESLYRQGKEPLKFENKEVILVDDGIATGATMLSAIRYLQAHGVKKTIAAAPVASKEAFKKIARETEVMALDLPEPFQSVGQFYENFEPVEDNQVVQLLG